MLLDANQVLEIRATVRAAVLRETLAVLAEAIGIAIDASLEKQFPLPSAPVEQMPLPFLQLVGERETR